MPTGLLKFKTATANRAIVGVALWTTLLANATYFGKVLEIYPPERTSLPFLLSIVVLQFALTVLLLGCAGIRYLIKPVLIFVLLATAAAAYFIDTFGIIVDVEMLRNVAQTDIGEAAELLTPKFVAYLVIGGLLPSIWLAAQPLAWRPPAAEAIARARLLGLAALAILACLVLFYKPYASFFREHKPVRFYSNPPTLIYSAGKFVAGSLAAGPAATIPVGIDARTPPADPDRELVIFVVGETARWDHFSLNGYARETNPLLERETLYNFSRMRSCGTSTARSVPCMFSPRAQADFSDAAGSTMENALDVLRHAGVSILWRENNTGSKGVAERVKQENFRDPAVNPVCEPECRDIGMLHGLSDFIDGVAGGDILIVLHQMGNHGPAYYKRYPPEFEVFRPSCRSNHIDTCSDDEIVNAYDNAIRYTDQFLARAIHLLKTYDDRFETALLYASDHGESLGEKGFYLHGLPDFIAPEAQTHVPAFIWLGANYHDADRIALTRRADRPASHDNLFHTLLGLFEIDTPEYDRGLDLIEHVESDDHSDPAPRDPTRS